MKWYGGMPVRPAIYENICTFSCTDGLFLVSLHLDRMGISVNAQRTKNTWLTLFNFISNMYRAMYKSELAQAAGVSQRTFSRYVQLQQAELKKLGVTPQTRLLPPKAVKLLCDNLCIEIWKNIRYLKNFRASPPEPANGMEKYRTFALSKGTIELERRAPKICFQAWQNLLPAQSVKKEVLSATTLNINH